MMIPSYAGKRAAERERDTMRHPRAAAVPMLLGILMVPGSLASTSVAVPASRQAAVQIGLELSKPKIMGGERVTATLKVNRNGNTQELVFQLENSNPSLVRFATPEIRLRPEESVASFEVATGATPIMATVTIKAALRSGEQVRAERTLDLVPAIIKGASLSQSTLNGTHGSKLNCRVELNANAPAGGIEFYVHLTVPSLSTDVFTLTPPNQRVPAGSRELSFEIQYGQIRSGGTSIRTGFGRQINSQTRAVEVFISLESNLRAKPTAPGTGSGKATFELIPLRVTSASVQPNSVVGGADALGSFTLSFPPGSGEVVGIGSAQVSPGVVAWGRTLGSSCQGDNLNGLEMTLTPGVTTYGFKVCTGHVATAATGNLVIGTRGANFPVPITVRP